MRRNITDFSKPWEMGRKVVNKPIQCVLCSLFAAALLLLLLVMLVEGYRVVVDSYQTIIYLKKEVRRLEVESVRREGEFLMKLEETQSGVSEKIEKMEIKVLNNLLVIEKDMIENDEVIQENIIEVEASLEGAIQQEINNSEVLASRISEVGAVVSEIKNKTDLIHVQGNLEISIIEPASSKIKIRLKP